MLPPCLIHAGATELLRSSAESGKRTGSLVREGVSWTQGGRLTHTLKSQFVHCDERCGADYSKTTKGTRLKTDSRALITTQEGSRSTRRLLCGIDAHRWFHFSCEDRHL